jgi:hypothetical protein
LLRKALPDLDQRRLMEAIKRLWHEVPLGLRDPAAPRRVIAIVQKRRALGGPVFPFRMRVGADGSLPFS